MIRPAKLLLILFAFVPFAHAEAQHGIMVREAIIRVAPDDSAQKIGTTGRGRQVVILGQNHDWINVFANVDQGRDITGWIMDKGVVRTTTPNGDRIVFAAAEDSEDQASRSRGRPGAAQDAMRLYASLAELLPKSPLAGEALYRSADI